MCSAITRDRSLLRLVVTLGACLGCSGVVAETLAIQWGGPGPLQIPGSTNVIAIAAGYSEPLLLREDGMVVGGPSGLSNVVAISTEWYRGLALVDPELSRRSLRRPQWRRQQFRVLAATAAGRRYALEYKDGWDSSEWMDLPAQRGEGNPIWLTDPQPSAFGRFYRLRAE